MLARYTNIRATPVFGGVRASTQVRVLKTRPDILVACPGRLLDLMGSGDVRLDNIEVLVLDEADHMLDMGFLPDIKRILARLPSPRQNLLFSATMPKEIRGLTQGLLHDAHVVELAHARPLETIDHAIYSVDQKRKTALLQHLLAGKEFRSAIVFLRTKHRARRLARDLDRTGHRAIALQGNMSQSQRERAMQGFRDGRYDVLVATDIAARGIDVAQVSHVINFDVPNTPDAYTHRIGRTGRSERSGKAYTFVTHEDHDAIRAIERKLDMKIPRVSAGEFAEAPRSEGRSHPNDRPERSRRPASAPKRGRSRRPAANASGWGKVGSGKAGAAKGTSGPARRPVDSSRAAGGRQRAGTATSEGRRPAGASFGAGVGNRDLHAQRAGVKPEREDRGPRGARGGREDRKKSSSGRAPFGAGTNSDKPRSSSRSRRGGRPGGSR